MQLNKQCTKKNSKEIRNVSLPPPPIFGCYFYVQFRLLCSRPLITLDIPAVSETWVFCRKILDMLLLHSAADKWLMLWRIGKKAIQTGKQYFILPWISFLLNSLPLCSLLSRLRASCIVLRMGKHKLGEGGS